MEEILKIAVVGIVGALCAVVVKKNSPEMGMLLTLTVGVVILIFALSAVSEIAEFIGELADTAEISENVLSPLMKTVGIAIITKVAAEVCRDAKEGAIASFVETAGGIAALFLALPLLKSVLNMVISLV